MVNLTTSATLVDSHCHLNRLNLEKYQGDWQKAIASARENQVREIISVCTVLSELPEILALMEVYPHVYGSVGLHPSETIEQEPKAEELIQRAKHPKIIAIGETGLDYHYQSVSPSIQRERFRRHIQAAVAIKKPLIVHIREAIQDVLAILEEEKAEETGVVLHCFTETWEMAKKALDRGYYLGFSGIVTFKKAEQVQQVAKNTPLDRILLETDAPYLAPNPMRGKSNEPAFLKYTADYLAQLRGLSFESLAAHTTQNFHRLFRVSHFRNSIE